MNWMLTDEELYSESIEEADYCALVLKIGNRAAQAQAKKLVEWGDELCEIVGHGGYGSKPKQRSQCPYCWQELRRQVGLE